MAVVIIDLLKQHQAEYMAPRKPTLVRVGPGKYLAISGAGAPATPGFQDAIGTLYSLAWTMKMARKFAAQDHYRVCPLEGLWWVGDGGCVEDWSTVPPEQFRWKLLIRVPEFISARDLQSAAATLQERGKSVAFPAVKLETLAEGLCVQQLHVGPYDAEAPTLTQMRQFAAEQNLVVSGPHHEIYFSDPRRVPKERLRTILRYPVKKAVKAASA